MYMYWYMFETLYMYTVLQIIFFGCKFTINIQFIDKVWMFICNNWQLAVQIIMIVCCCWFVQSRKITWTASQNILISYMVIIFHGHIKAVLEYEIFLLLLRHYVLSSQITWALTCMYAGNVQFMIDFYLVGDVLFTGKHVISTYEQLHQRIS